MDASRPGQWDSAETFGDPQTFLNNITQNGYYVYSAPVAFADECNTRGASGSTRVQIAIKAAGAIQTSNILVVINA